MSSTNEQTGLMTGLGASSVKVRGKERELLREKVSPRNASHNLLSEASTMAYQRTSASSQDSRFSGEKWSSKALTSTKDSTRNEREGSNGFPVENPGFWSEVERGRKRELTRLPPLRGKCREDGSNSDGKKDGAIADILPNLTHSGKRPDVVPVPGRQNSRSKGIPPSLGQSSEGADINAFTEVERGVLDELKSQIYQSNLDREKQRADYLNKRRLSCFATAPGVDGPFSASSQTPIQFDSTKGRRYTVSYPVALEAERPGEPTKSSFTAAESVIHSLPQACRSGSNQPELTTSPIIQSQNSLAPSFSPMPNTVVQPESLPNSATEVRWLEESLSESHDVESIAAVSNRSPRTHRTRSDPMDVDTGKNSTTKVRWHEESLSESHDAESIAAVSNRSPRTRRSRSDPMGVDNVKSLISQLLHDSESQAESVKEKVERFLKKKNPARPSSSLRLNSVQQDLELRRFVYNAGQQTSPERKKMDEVINVHTCPSLNLFLDRSWVYSDKEGKCRYIRGPATPIPPVESVFEKDD